MGCYNDVLEILPIGRGLLHHSWALAPTSNHQKRSHSGAEFARPQPHHPRNQKSAVEVQPSPIAEAFLRYRLFCATPFANHLPLDCYHASMADDAEQVMISYKDKLMIEDRV